MWVEGVVAFSQILRLRTHSWAEVWISAVQVKRGENRLKRPNQNYNLKICNETCNCQGT